jgi:hypothetical protein
VQSSAAAASRSGGVTARDLLILLKLAAAGPDVSAAGLAAALTVPAADVSLGLERCRRVGLVDADKRRVEIDALVEFLEHAARYVFPAEHRGRGRVSPLDSEAPRSAAEDARLGELLHLVDVLRTHGREQRRKAARELSCLLRGPSSDSSPLTEFALGSIL